MCVRAASLFSGKESAATTKKVGKTNPIATPRGWQAAPIVVAITLSFSPYHIAASLGIATARKGWPIPART